MFSPACLAAPHFLSGLSCAPLCTFRKPVFSHVSCSRILHVSCVRIFLKFCELHSGSRISRLERVQTKFQPVRRVSCTLREVCFGVQAACITPKTESLPTIGPPATILGRPTQTCLVQEAGLCGTHPCSTQLQSQGPADLQCLELLSAQLQKAVRAFTDIRRSLARAWGSILPCKP